MVDPCCRPWKPGSKRQQIIYKRPRGKKLMRILLTNDDGIYSKGIEALYCALFQEHDVTVVAPETGSTSEPTLG